MYLCFSSSRRRHTRCSLVTGVQTCALPISEWKTPMLVITSENDFRIPYTQGLAAFTALQRRGVPSELLVFPDENHWVLKGANSVQWHQTEFNWLGRYLKM